MRRARPRNAEGTPPGGDWRALTQAVAEALADLFNDMTPPSVAVAGVPLPAGPAGPAWSPRLTDPPRRGDLRSPRGPLRHDVDTTSEDTRRAGLGPARHLPGRRPRPAPRPLPVPHGDGLESTLPGDGALPHVDAELAAGGLDTTELPDAPAVDGAVSAEHTETWRLVARAQQGDGEAFGQLYDRYVDVVYRFVYFRVNDRALAEDFTSETFLRALRRIGSISYQGRDIGAWFVTIARNIIFDHMKSARHRLEVTTADTIEGDDRAPSTESAVLDLLTSERLMAAVKQLGDEQRECVMLRFIQGFSVSETAAVMGKNDGAIKALQHRAVRKLAELVGGELR